MSINKRYLPEIEVLKSSLKEKGSHEFYRTYIRKTDAYIGSVESSNFIDTFCKKYFKNENTEFTEIVLETISKK